MSFDQRGQQVHTQYNAAGDITISQHLAPISLSDAQRQVSRARMIKRVRRFWIKGVLEKALLGVAPLVPAFLELKDAVANPWKQALEESEQTTEFLPQGTSITQIYDDGGGDLLLLGEPGSGKTTLLLELARDLLNRAEFDHQQPMPVVFLLSSWANKRQPLTGWLAEELESKYQVPRELSQAWVKNNQILPLLDGLDEVASSSRAACLDAINVYRQTHDISIVVCSRSADYLALPTRALLQRAVVVCPLTLQQVDEYLTQIDEQGEVVRNALHSNPFLQELAITPLMLNVLVQVYQEEPFDDFVPASSMGTRQQILETYVRRMLSRRGIKTCYTPQQTRQWLAWLARQLKQHNQTVFYIERMQPDWLIGGRVPWIYEYLATRFPDVLVGSIVTLLIITMLFSAVFSVTFELCYCSVGGLVSVLLGKGKPINPLAESSNIHVQRSFWKRVINIQCLGNGLLLGLIYGLTYGSAYGLRIGLIYGSIFGLVGALLSSILGQGMLKLPPEEKIGQSRESRWYNLINFGYPRIALVVGLSYGLGYGLSTETTNQLRISQGSVLANTLAYVLAYVLIGVLICLILERRKHAIQPAEMIVWSWRTLWRNLITIRHWGNGLFVGLLVGSIIGLSIGLREEQPTIGLLFGLNAGLIFGVNYWLLLGIFKALSSEMIDEHQHVKPNQGTWASARNSIIIGFISGCISWLVCSLSYTLSYTFIDNFSAALSIGQLVARSIGLLVGLSVGLLCGLLNGGLAFLQHWTLHLLLWHAGSIPWSYPRFLDYAVERILLRKVGGGYIFIHQELLEYFASLSKNSL